MAILFVTVLVVDDDGVPPINTVPVASGSVSVRSVLVFGAAMVSVPVPLALAEILTLLMLDLSAQQFQRPVRLLLRLVLGLLWSKLE